MVVKRGAQLTADLLFLFNQNVFSISGKRADNHRILVSSKLHCLELKTRASTIPFSPFVLKYNTKSVSEKNSLPHLQKP